MIQPDDLQAPQDVAVGEGYGLESASVVPSPIESTPKTEAYEPVEPIGSPIVLRGVWKGYRSMLDIDRLPESLKEVLRAFGVERRLVERHVLREAHVRIEPRSITAVVGASGAGKTTLLRLIIGASGKKISADYFPDRGSVEAPDNVKLGCLIPGECEPGDSWCLTKQTSGKSVLPLQDGHPQPQAP